MHRTFTAVLFGCSLLFLSSTASADAIPYSADIGYSAPDISGFGGSLVHQTQDDACRAALSNPDSYTHFTTTTAPVAGDCWYFIPSISQKTPLGWARRLTCPRGGLPLDRMAPAPQCGCEPGQKFLNPNAPPVVWDYPVPNGQWERYTPCVLDSTPRCDVPAIPPHTPDPYPALPEELSPRMETALSCLQAAIGGQGGSSVFKSGYRPPAYNAHLRAVYDQAAKLKDKGPECNQRRAELVDELKRHDLGKTPPADGSLHTTREAFDLKSSLSRDVTNGLAINCNAFAPRPLGSPNHFEHTR